MEPIDKNPYRILGVFSNAPLKEITANKTKLARYASVGKSVSFDADMNGLLAPINRSAEVVEKAFSDLSLAQDKIKHALFWFAKDTFFDELALDLLNAGNVNKAAELFGKSESWSGEVNTGVLAMVQGDLGRAIGCLTKMIHTTDYRTAMGNALCGDIYQIEEADLAKQFVDMLKEMRPASELYALFVANGFDASDADYLKGSMVDELIEKLNTEISKAKTVKEDGVAIYEAGVALQRNAMPLLKQLEGLLGADSLEYKLIVDKYANAVLQCCIDSFNSLQNKIDDGEAKRFKEYAPKINVLLALVSMTKVSDVVKDRIETNMKTVSDIVKDLNGYVLGNFQICYYCGKNKANPSAQIKETLYYETGRGPALFDSLHTNPYEIPSLLHSTRIYYKKVEIGINRCEHCKEIHENDQKGYYDYDSKKDENMLFKVCVWCFAISAIGVWAISKSFIIGLFAGLCLIGIICPFVKKFLDETSEEKRREKKLLREELNVKKQGDVYDHPVVKKMINEGWTTYMPS